MARAAGVDRHFLLRGTGLDDVTARTGDRGVAVGRMNVFLHFLASLFKIFFYYTITRIPSATKGGGRYWIRTSDPFRVKEVL